MAAKAVFKSSLPSLPDEPNHPSNFTFPKRSFGKTKPVFCAARSQWFCTWPFLHYDETHLMLLHYHQDITDQLDLRLVANEYITKNETRQTIFATFKL